MDISSEVTESITKTLNEIKDGEFHDDLAFTLRTCSDDVQKQMVKLLVARAYLNGVTNATKENYKSSMKIIKETFKNR